MSVDFNREVDRRSTSDVKWRPEGLKGYLPIEVSENEIRCGSQTWILHARSAS